MFKQLRSALLMLAILTFVTGVIYPLIITGVAHLEFPGQARGSLAGDPEQPVGSTLIGQANTDPRYFWPRPSATGYSAMPSGASNPGPTSAALAGLVAETHYLRVYFAQLRQKLEEDPSLPRLILTEPGVGYRLAA